MEWRKSTLSGAELERKRKEYIEAAMKMSDRAQPASEPLRAEHPEEKAALPPFPAAPTGEETAPKKEAEEIAFAEPEIPPAAETEKPEESSPPELLHEPEPIEEAEERQFGVFDVDELIEAVRKGEVDGEKLREASEILEEMSGKTEEMQKLAGQPNRTEELREPPGLNQSVRRHNGGSCPRCGQGNRNGTRR